MPEAQETVPKLQLGLVTPFDKLRTKGISQLLVSLSSHGLPEYPGFGRAMFTSHSHAVAEAIDKINDKYGEFVITPALMMGMDETIVDRIAFGGVKELEELCL